MGNRSPDRFFGIGQNLAIRPEADGRNKESGTPIRDLGMSGGTERQCRTTYATAYSSFKRKSAKFSYDEANYDGALRG